MKHKVLVMLAILRCCADIRNIIGSISPETLRIMIKDFDTSAEERPHGKESTKIISLAVSYRRWGSLAYNFIVKHLTTKSKLGSTTSYIDR